jgi:hypothetical protein
MNSRLLSTALMLSTLSIATASAGDCLPCYPLYAVQNCYPVAAGLSYEPSGVIYNRPDCRVWGGRAWAVHAAFPPPRYRIDLGTGVFTRSPW